MTYSRHDIIRSHHWLTHTPGYTEVTILHPQYHAGDHAWNQQHQAWPITRYVQRTRDLLHLVHEHTGERMICYGLNPRPAVLRHEDGRIRSAKEPDINLSQTLLIDIDLQGTVTPARLDDLRRFLNRADEYVTSKRLQRPTRARTSRGSHLLFPFKPITVAEHPTIRDQLRTFKEEFLQENHLDLSGLEARVDNTQDLRRMTRVYGTTKPGNTIISRFYGNYERTPDPALREYLLRLPSKQRKASAPLPSITIGDLLPAGFEDRPHTDTILNELWHSRGKPPGTDRSDSGYDYTIAKYLAQSGDLRPDDIATIIALRPTGASERARKGVDYVRRTVKAACGTRLSR
ncbi:MAG: hypothetical protein SFV54_25075 [Bryobacteraceae bacterium]|nr:hypothetical protein [Bryobacteraceae bacterium]